MELTITKRDGTKDPNKEVTTTKQLQINSQSPAQYNNWFGIYGQISFDNVSQLTSFTYQDTSNNMAQACLRIYLMNNVSYTPYSSSCSNQSSGIITLPITGNGTFLAEGIAILNSQNGGISSIIDYKYISIAQPNPNQTIGKFGEVITIMLILTASAIGAAANSILLGLSLDLGAMFFAYQMGWIGLSIYSTGGVLVVLVIMIAIISFRRNF